jgi:hypothetical protein
MLAVTIVPHSWMAAWGRGYIVPGASHRQIASTARPGRILLAEQQVASGLHRHNSYSLDLVSHTKTATPNQKGQRWPRSLQNQKESVKYSQPSRLCVFIKINQHQMDEKY